MKKNAYKIFTKINLLLFISILFISCSNYIATDPLASSGYGYDIYSIPDNVDPKYLIKADTKEADTKDIEQTNKETQSEEANDKTLGVAQNENPEQSDLSKLPDTTQPTFSQTLQQDNEARNTELGNERLDSAVNA